MILEIGSRPMFVRKKRPKKKKRWSDKKKRPDHNEHDLVVKVNESMFMIKVKKVKIMTNQVFGAGDQKWCNEARRRPTSLHFFDGWTFDFCSGGM